MRTNSTHFCLFCFFTLSLLSCTTDAYDKGEGEYSNLRAELADLTINADKQCTAALTDEGEQLTMERSFTVNWIQRPDTTYRAYIYYTPLDDKQVRIVSIGQVLVLRPRKENEPMTDPVGVESMWLSTSRRYLNASLLLKVGHDDEAKDVHHVLGATLDTLMANPDGTATLHLSLYHNQGGVPEYYTQRTYVSIPTEQIEADSIHLRINTYQGWTERTLSLK